MPFGDVILQDLEQEMALRVTRINPIQQEEVKGEGTDQLFRLSSPQNPRKKSPLQQTVNEPVSSYFKVSLTSEKARRRQNSLGQRSSQFFVSVFRLKCRCHMSLRRKRKVYGLRLLRLLLSRES